MLNQPPPPSEEEVKAMAQSAMGDAGIGSKVITPAAEVFMGMGTDDGTIMSNMEEVSNKKKANLDTSMDTLMGALDGGDEFLISSAAKAVENATENLGASNISGATQNTNDKSWKHKYAVDEHKQIKKKVENLETLKNNALESGNTSLAAVYDQGIDAAQAELDASQDKVDSTASALTNAEIKADLDFFDSAFNSGSFLLIKCISSFFSDSCSARLEPIDPVAPKIKYLPDII